jgi:heme/copper-type cytochrome/quinol oxidase subunit 2
MIVGVTWYLCGLFAFSALNEAFAVYNPLLKGTQNFRLAVSACLALVIGITASWLRAKRAQQPESRLFRSRTASILVAGIAVLVTTFLFLQWFA